jgi:sterol 3beta-glucosyltransferase
MKIALLTLGTRGDVQPYAVLGLALKQRGHQVTLSTAKNFEGLVRSYDIDFLPVEADFQAFLETDEGKKMMKNPFRARKNLEKWVYPMIYGALITFFNLAKESDKVLYHIKTLADYFADQFPEKMIRANVVPAFQPIGEFVNPVFSGLHLPRFLNKFSYRLSDLGLEMMSKPVRLFREHEGLSKKIGKIPLPSLYGISQYYLKKPGDYPDDAYFTGFWTSSTQQILDPELTDFIDQGQPPLLLTFGSMPFVSGLNLSEALARLTTELNIRLIVIKGWGLYDTSDLSTNKSIRVIDSAPYDKLFPLVKAVIHHGGIGTISACLLAGKPFLSCPVMYPLGDQHFWGMIGYQKGIALKPIPLKKLTQQKFVGGVKELIENTQLYANARKISDQLREEDGIRNAVEQVENL